MNSNCKNVFYFNNKNLLEKEEYEKFRIFKDNQTVIIYESMTNLELLYISTIFFKLGGAAEYQPSNLKYNVNMDLPNFFNLKKIKNVYKLENSLLIIGSHPRYEASVLNTNLRVEQMNKNFSYYAVAPSLDFNLKIKHHGNGFRTLFSLLENHSNLTRFLYREKNPALLVSVESFKGVNGGIFQNLLRIISRKLFVKKNYYDRFSALTPSLTPLNLLTLGLGQGARSNLHLDKFYFPTASNLVVFQPHKVAQKKWVSNAGYTNCISFATHETTQGNWDLGFPVTSLYENKGSTFTIGGEIKEYCPVVAKPISVSSSEETLITALRIYLSDSELLLFFKKLQLFWLEIFGSFFSLSGLKHIKLGKDGKELSECGVQLNLSLNYAFNYFTWNEKAHEVKLALLPVVIEDFYMTDLISENSLTMAHAALFSQNIYSEYLRV